VAWRRGAFAVLFLLPLRGSRWTKARSLATSSGYWIASNLGIGKRPQGAVIVGAAVTTAQILVALLKRLRRDAEHHEKGAARHQG
jgi:hypothetical protein